MKTYTINVYNDPGHGWGKVPLYLLKNLGITEKITSYSYYRKGFAYLEEDLDLSTFLYACSEKGITVNFRDSYTNRSSKIRNYFRFDKVRAME